MEISSSTLSHCRRRIDGAKLPSWNNLSEDNDLCYHDLGRLVV